MRSTKQRRVAGGVLLAAIAVGALGMPPASGAATVMPRGSAAAAPRTVTLITGDRVTLIDGGHASVAGGPGRSGVPFVTRRINGHLYVVPADALPLLAADRLDRRLFDITALIGYGYDDRRADLPLIVQYPPGATRSATAFRGTGTRDLPALRAIAIRPAKASPVWPALTRTPGWKKIWLDGLRKPSLAESVPQIGAPAAWAQGLDGTGQLVAVLDTGIDVGHPDLAGQVTASANFTEGNEDDRDLDGHGTHVASTIAGTGAASGGRYRGVAPGAHLLNGKVCIQLGCAESWILAGMQWAADEGAKVVNLSLGDLDSPGLDPVEQAVQALTAERDVLFVVAAGNAGPDKITVNTPGSADAALTVGAVDKSDQLAFFSSRGLRIGDSALKPDLTAPGVDITAARSADGSIGQPGDAYATLSGTSMAAPHVAGAAAILRQLHPAWSAGQLKAALMGSAAANPALAPHEQGAGRVDIARAISQNIVASPPSISFGRQDWPHEDDPPLPVKVTYRNEGATAVTLALALSTSAPAGMFTVTPSTISVPPGAQASVTVTANTSIGSLIGYAEGRLVATGAGAVVQTPYAVELEAESYDLTLSHLDRSGRPTGSYDTFVMRTDDFAVYAPHDPAGTETLRLPRGRYLIVGLILQGAPDRPDISLLVRPRLDLTRAESVVLDARKAGPISVRVPDGTAAPVLVDVTGFIHAPAAATDDFSVLTDRLDGVHMGQIGPDQPVPEFTSRVHVTLAQPRAAGDVTDSPYAYLLTWYFEGRMVTGLRRRLSRSQLATVRADHARAAAGASGIKRAFANPADRDVAGWIADLPFRLPFSRTEYYTTDGGLRWTRVLDELVPPEGELVSHMIAGPVTLRPGATTVELWNRGVFGPTVAAPPFAETWASRTGDTIQFTPPIFSDGTGREGISLTAAETTALFRNGKPLAEGPGLGGFFDVPPGPAKYRVEVAADRAEPFDLSTKVRTTWTFRSAHVDGTGPVRLPLWTIQFTPPVDAANTAPAGGPFVIPVRLVPQPGAEVGTPTGLTVDVSYDDGRTWRHAPVIPLAGVRVVVVQHPAGYGYTSLRASTTDSRGNSFTLTVIHAYRIS